MAIPGARQYFSVGGRNDFQQRTGRLFARQIWHSFRGRYVHSAGWREALYSAQCITRTSLFRLKLVNVLVSNSGQIASTWTWREIDALVRMGIFGCSDSSGLAWLWRYRRGIGRHR